MSKNVIKLKHAFHKWGGYTSLIYGGFGPESQPKNDFY